MGKSYILDWLRVTSIPLSVISRHTKISRKALHNWKNGSNPTLSSLKKLEHYYENSTSVEKERLELAKKSGNVVDPQYVVSLQKKHIETIESNKIQKDVWECLEFDIKQKLQLRKIKIFSLTREMISVGDWSIWEKKLGYTKKELQDLFDVGVEYPLFEHPVHAIITTDSNTYLESIAKNFLTLYSFLKNAVGTYYIPFHLSYITKDNKIIPSVAYCLIEWKSMIVDVKVKFFDVS